MKIIQINLTYHRVKTKCTKTITFAHTDTHTGTTHKEIKGSYDDYYSTSTNSSEWLSGSVVKTSDSRSTGHGFVSRLVRCQVQWAICASVTKH